jgi:hypothetical protein
MAIEFRNPRELLPHEGYSRLRAVLLMLRMLAAGRFTRPILIDAQSGTILDGHHRCKASRWLGLPRVPVCSVDYLAEGGVAVHARRPQIAVTKAEVLASARAGTPFPRKTTRHVYTAPRWHPVALWQLRAARATNTTHREPQLAQAQGPAA